MTALARTLVAIRVPFVLLGSAGTELVVRWAGAESEGLGLVRARGQELASVARAHRYWAPR